MYPLFEVNLTHLVNVDLVHVDQRDGEHEDVEELDWFYQMTDARKHLRYTHFHISLTPLDY